jgi:hypothetical protein
MFRVIYTYVTPTSTEISFGGGAVVRSARLEVLFWGQNWVASKTSPSMEEIMSAIDAIVASPYLSEMEQYGFSQIESIGYHLVESNPPASTYSDSDVFRIVSGLIDAGTFPEPDEPGGRIIYFVLPHSGTAYTGSDEPAAGAHGPDWMYDFPFDVDYAWVAWANFGSIDNITSVFTHELVETISDPEQDAWINPNDIEIADLCYPNNGPVADFACAAYYSRRLNKCVVPSAGLVRRVVVSERDETFGPIFETEGVTMTDPGSRCFSGLYSWRLFGQAQRIILSADVSTYHSPGLKWKVNGQEVFGHADFDLPVDNGYDPLVEFAPSVLHPKTASISADTSVNNHELTLTCLNPDVGVVLLKVTWEVEDSGFIGYQTKRTGMTELVFSCRTRYMDSRFYKDRNRCFLGNLEQLNQIAVQIGPLIDKGDPGPVWVEKSLSVISANIQTAITEATRLLTALKQQSP